MDEIGDSPVNERLVSFRMLYLAVQMVGIALIVLMCAWVSIFLGGVGVSEPHLEFNWHPILMTIGMIFLYGNSIILYRGLRYGRKKNLKISHASLFGIVMVMVILGLVAAFDSHNYANPPIPNLYSLHSWLGLATVILFALQWLSGFYSFLYPEIRGPLKAAYMPIHIYFGLFAYVLAVATSLLGLSEKAFFHMKNIKDLPNEGVVVNMIGCLIVLFAALICYLATNVDYKRKPLPEDAILLTGHSE